MSALAEVAAAGGKIWTEGDKLRYQIPKERPDLLGIIRAEKPRLLPILQMVERACKGLDLDPLKLALSLEPSDLGTLGKDSTKQLRIYAEAVADRLARERGEIPAHYTAKTVCSGCGPVPIFRGAPEKVAGCPWCWNRIRGLPMPNGENKNA